MAPRLLPLACGLALAACASGSGSQPIDAHREIDGDVDPDAAAIDAADPDAATIDAAAIDARVIDAAVIDAPAIDAPTDAPAIDAPPPVIASLLLTEIVLAPTGGELIEVVNPTAAAIDLSNYYLSDAPSYFRLPAGVAAVAADTSDFVARFPSGASIPAHGVVTVAIDTAANFTTAYPATTPTYSIASATMTVLTTGTATLTNTGEPIALFFWNGQTDLVTDVDLMICGTPSAANLFANKSGVALDGPDPDGATTAYLTDVNTLPTQTAPASNRSTKRLALESATVETQAGTGNGVNGHDETSEMTGVTWDGTGYTAPTPGTVPAALLP